MRRKMFVVVVLVGLLVGGSASNAQRAQALSLDDIQAQIQVLLARIVELRVQQSSLQASPAVSTNVSSSVSSPMSRHRICAELNRNLSRGVRGDDVVSLQEFLRDEGYFSAAATGYFGPATAHAVAQWQAAQGISAVGVIGPVSRERIRVWCMTGQGGTGSTVGNGAVVASPSYGAAPLNVTFIFHPQEEIGQYYIEFGDGQGQLMTVQQIYCIRAPCISPSRATHTYGSGVYTVTVSRYIACLYTNPRCMVAQPPPLASTQVVVIGTNTGNQPPTISSLSGPTTLLINQSGTWTIHASDPEQQSLSYSISWGDEASSATARAQLVADVFVQAATFTHTYSAEGTYTVRVTVRDASGAHADSSMTVRVGAGSTICTMEYAPVCGRPPGCMNTCLPGMYCTLMCQLNPAQTYSNRCMLHAAGAEYLYEGLCTSTY